MGREVRQVPKDWKHPQDSSGGYIPLHARSILKYNTEEDGIKPEECMPDFQDATHIQMYETCTEGTPISPVCETPEELARWLADNKASAFADQTATYEEWLAMIGGGWAPSAILSMGDGMQSGVAYVASKKGR